MSHAAQRIRDPLHNLIEFNPGEFEHTMWKVIQTRPFQRLRRVKQLGLGELVYPGATHTRFAHSVGVFHTARILINRIKRLLGEDEFRPNRAQRALAAALVHDVGHGPFSHAFEDVGKRLSLKMAKHEPVSDQIIRDSEITIALDELGNGFSADVAQIIGSRSPKDIYCAVVSSQFDADRLDYMQRDRLMCGTQHGAIDFDWLESNLEIGEVSFGVDDTRAGSTTTFVLGPKAVYAAESYLLGLFQLYPTVYYHKATRGAEKIFSNLMVRVFTHAMNDSVAETGLPPNHPIIQFGKNPTSIDAAQALDDFVFWGAIELMAGAEDTAISSLARRLRDRELFKSIEIFDDDVLAEARQSSDKDFLNKVTTHLENSLGPEDIEANSTPRFLLDRVTRPIYKQFDESKGPLNQISIRTRDGELKDVAEVSPVINAIGTFEALRVYVDPNDGSTRKKVLETAEEAISYARNH